MSDVQKKNCLKWEHSKLYPVISPEGELLGHGRLVDNRYVRLFNHLMSTGRPPRPVKKPHELSIYPVLAEDGRVVGEVPLVNRSYILANRFTVSHYINYEVEGEIT